MFDGVLWLWLVGLVWDVLFWICCLMIVLRLFSLFFVVSVGLGWLLWGIGVGGVGGTC